MSSSYLPPYGTGRWGALSWIYDATRGLEPYERARQIVEYCLENGIKPPPKHTKILEGAAASSAGTSKATAALVAKSSSKGLWIGLGLLALTVGGFFAYRAWKRRNAD